MATNQNNIHINSFSKGMNTDTSLDMVGNEQYVFGQNVRITANALLQGAVDSNSKEGTITPVPSGQADHGALIDDENLINDKYKWSILGIATLGDIGAIIAKDVTSHWHIYRINYNKDDDQLTFNHLFKSANTTSKNKFSVVINRELEDVVKLYIADGKHQIMSLNIHPDGDKYAESITNEEQLINNNYFPTYQVAINNKITGTLKTGQVQYTYRFYHKYGISSKLAPLTSKIQVIDPSRQKQIGNAEDTQTTIGFQLKIYCPQEAVDVFDHIQIYRLSYIKPNSDAEVDLIYDSKLPTNPGDVKINDNGLESLQQLSIQEFAAIDSINIVPECIEQNQNYLFAADIDDNTRLRFSKGQFDATAYQFNSENKIVLSKNNDTTYEQFEEYDSVESIEDDYVLNKYSDMTIEELSNNPCKYDEDGYLGGTGKNVSWRFVTTEIPLDSAREFDSQHPPVVQSDKVAPLYYLKRNGNSIVTENAGVNTENVFADHNIFAESKLEYNDIFTSSTFRSLRRDEVYRYGIVLYDKHGTRSDVQWIADIRTPSEDEFPSIKLDQSTVVQNIQENTWTSSLWRQEEALYGAGHSGGTVLNGTPEILHLSGRYDPTLSRHFKAEQQSVGLHTTGNNSIIYPSEKNASVHSRISDDSLCSGAIVFSKVPPEQWNKGFHVPGQTFEYKTVLFMFTPIKDIISTIQEQIGDDATIVEGNTGFRIETHAEDSVNSTQFFIDDVSFSISVSNNSYYKYVNVSFLEIIPQLETRIDNSYDQFIKEERQVYARPIGIQFNVHDVDTENISAYQIVRCAKTAAYTKNLMQCAVSRPVKQFLPTSDKNWEQSVMKKYSPYYPLPFLTSDYVNTVYYAMPNGGGENLGGNEYSATALFRAANNQNNELFQIFSPEIQFVQDDALAKLQSFVSKMSPIAFAYGPMLSNLNEMLTHENTYAISNNGVLRPGYDVIHYNDNNHTSGNWRDVLFVRNWTKGADQDSRETPYDKNDLSFVQKYYDRADIRNKNSVEIRDIKNVSNPTWEQGFDSINGSGGVIVSGVKAYKSYSTSISSYEYDNWVCNGMYDLRISCNMSAFGHDDIGGFSVMIEPGHASDTSSAWTRQPASGGWIGPGPRCFLATIKNEDRGYLLGYNDSTVNGIGSAIVNITHVPTQYAGLTKEEKQYDVYYGFGNIKNIVDSSSDKFNVFDGDVYITPCEIVSMYKTYDFNSYDTLPSAQFIYYVPMESVVNTYFDYGMGFRNTESKTVQIEPGEIGGIVSQARPEHQYNMIYSDNNISNDIYTVQTLEDNNKNYPQRIHYSTLKTNGELIDNWQMFKALNYIDADTRYGQITNMLTNKDVIYFWQNQAFGKLSVNERSLVTDNNSNTVQLGQGGVLQRTDYVDTRYGMRPEDYSAISAEGSIYWIDIMNKAIVMSNGQSVINLGEQLNVQSYINANISDNIPTIHYDLQNNELLCKCLEDGKQMVFNIKLNVATSVYDREYEDIIVFNNVLFGIIREKLRKYNYIQGTPLYERPTKLEFVVNPSAGVTKTFDNQEIVTMYRGPYVDDNSYMEDKQFSFTTNIIDTIQKNPDGCTDREGNVRYAIPRYAENYGNRMRGKWMKVDIEDYKPKYEHSISHILTKFRQSFS